MPLLFMAFMSTKQFRKSHKTHQLMGFNMSQPNPLVIQIRHALERGFSINKSLNSSSTD